MQCILSRPFRVWEVSDPHTSFSLPETFEKSRATKIRLNEYLIVKYQESGDQVLQYYLVGFVNCKDTVTPLQVASSCYVLNLYLHRWIPYGSQTNGLYTFQELEGDENLQSELLLLVFNRCEKTPLKREWGKQ